MFTLYNVRYCLISLRAGKFSMLLLSSADFFQNHCFRKKKFRNTIRVSKSLDPD